MDGLADTERRDFRHGFPEYDEEQMLRPHPTIQHMQSSASNPTISAATGGNCTTSAVRPFAKPLARAPLITARADHNPNFGPSTDRKANSVMYSVAGPASTKPHDERRGPRIVQRNYTHQMRPVDIRMVGRTTGDRQKAPTDMAMQADHEQPEQKPAAYDDEFSSTKVIYLPHPSQGDQISDQNAVGQGNGVKVNLFMRPLAPQTSEATSMTTGSGSGPLLNPALISLTDEPGKTTTTHGITASYSKNRHGFSNLLRVKSTEQHTQQYENPSRSLIHDLLKQEAGDEFGPFGAIDEGEGKEDEEEEWINKIDVSKFAEDISNDLNRRLKKHKNRNAVNPYPKPTWSYSSLIALALKNSETGQLTVSEIYAFMLENFPYFRTAPAGWKNSVRHNLSLNKCFQKVELEHYSSSRKSCLWMISPERADKLEADIRKWRDRGTVIEGLARPQDLAAIESGTKGLPDMELYTKTILRTSAAPPNARAHASQEALVQALVKSLARDNERVARSEQSIEEVKVLQHEDGRLPVRRLAPPLELIHAPKEEVEERSLMTPPPMCEAMDIVLEAHIESETLCPSGRQFATLSFASDALSQSPARCSDFASINGFRTPPKMPLAGDLSSSPVLYASCLGSFDSARDAMNDNSLMSAALEESPYKGPITFPIC